MNLQKFKKQLAALTNPPKPVMICPRGQLAQQFFGATFIATDSRAARVDVRRGCGAMGTNTNGRKICSGHSFPC